MIARKYIIFSVVVLALLFIWCLFLPAIAEAAVKDWQKGASMYTYDKEGFATPEFKESLKAWKATGATYISFVIPYYQKDITSSKIMAKEYMPSNEVLTNAIEYAHSIGLKVMLKVHVTSDDGQWQAYINPSDRKAWFKSYGTMLNDLADLAEKTKAEQISIGTELIGMTTYTSRIENTQAWIEMIQGVRARYKGTLTYSANWGGTQQLEEAMNIGFWSHLDYIGISAYYQLAPDNPNPTTQDFIDAWKVWDGTKIEPLHIKFKKPIIFTEVGYRSVPGAHAAPYDGGEKGGIDLALQANLYQALFQYWNSKNYMAGIHIWDWKLDPLEGGPGNNQYTPHFKPAEQVFKNWFNNKIITASAIKNNHTAIGRTTVLNLATTTTLKRGTHVFRANLLNRENYTYATSWQVDGGEYHWMSDNTDGHIYEEDLVDVSGWWWRGRGPYKITFITREFRELGEKIISQRTIDLYLKP